ncbi:MAG: hypothetical protein KAJ19_27685 [Gammaproteobacteria bacterium]|nr:hypothetical protein [Gammaproteobacteria bacterium]
MTDVVRATELDWSNWSSSLLMTAFGIVAVFSGNLLAFLLTWTFFDITGVVILLVQLQTSFARRQVVMVFFLRLLSIICLFIAGVISINENTGFLLEIISPTAIVFIVLAVGLRLGSVSGNMPILKKDASRRSLGTVIRMVSTVVTLVFLVRISPAMGDANLPAILWLLLFSLVGLIALLSGAAWVLAKDEIDGRQAWIIGMSAIVTAAALRGQAEASMAWGLTTVFSGGLIFLASVRSKISLWISLLGLVGISALPFTPAWNTLALYSQPFNLSMILYFVAMVLLMWGFAHHATQLLSYQAGVERWIKVVYPLGLLFILIIQVGFGWLMKPEIGEVPLFGWILGPMISLLAALGFIWQQRGGRAPQLIVKSANSAFTLSWVYAIINSAYRTFSRVIDFITNVLEGEGGLLWVILWIVLFLSILVISLGA